MSKNHLQILELENLLKKTTDANVIKIIQDNIAKLQRTDGDENGQDLPLDTKTKIDKSDAPSKDFKDYNGSKVFEPDKSKISSSFKQMLEAEDKKKSSRNFYLVKDENRKKGNMPGEVDKNKNKIPEPDVPPFFDYEGTTEASLSKTKVINSVIFDDKKGHFYYYSVNKNVFLRLPDSLGDLELAPRFMSTDPLVVTGETEEKKYKPADYEGFISNGMKYADSKLSEDVFSLPVAKLREALRTKGLPNNSIHTAKDLIYTQNDKPVILSPGLGLVLGEASSGKTAFIKSFGASMTTIGEPTADSLPFDRRTFIQEVVNQVNKNSISALDSIRLLLLEGDNLVSGGVSIASASILTALASALARFNKQYIIAVNPSSAKASAAVGDAFLGSVTSIFQLNKYNECRYSTDRPWLGVNGLVSTRNYSRHYYQFQFKQEV